MHLSCKAGLTDRVRGRFRLDFKPSNKLLAYDLLHISIIVMNKAPVPQGEV